MKIDFSRIMGLMVQRFGSQTAIVNVERNRRWTFAEYHVLTNRIANAMHDALGLRKGDVALAMLHNDSLCLLHFPTIFKQHATMAFGNFRDSKAEHLWQIDFLKPQVVFIENESLPTFYLDLRERGAKIVVMDPLDDTSTYPDVLSFWDLVNQASEDNPAVELDTLEHVPLLRFTGGTTGKGKCARYSIDNFLATRDAANAVPGLELGPGCRFLHMAPLSHGSLLLFWPTFLNGGVNYTVNLPDMTYWAQVAESESITHGFLVPTLLYRLADMNAAKVHNLSSLRRLVYAAAPMAPQRLRQLIEQFGPIFVQAYGSTETIQFMTVLSVADHEARTPDQIKRLASAGQVVAGGEVCITDDEGNDLPTGSVGEIRLRSRATISGYHQNPEASQRELQNGFWLSGDLGYFDEQGYLFIVDRKKDMIISGGFNVYAVEVEAILLEHPAVFGAAVVGIPHPEWGEAVHAEVVLRPGSDVAVAQLIEHCKSKLNYKAPKTIALVQELPVSAVGKVMRRKVREKYWADQSRSIN